MCTLQGIRAALMILMVTLPLTYYCWQKQA